MRIAFVAFLLAPSLLAAEAPTPEAEFVTAAELQRLACDADRAEAILAPPPKKTPSPEIEHRRSKLRADREKLSASFQKLMGYPPTLAGCRDAVDVTVFLPVPNLLHPAVGTDKGAALAPRMDVPTLAAQLCLASVAGQKKLDPAPRRHLDAFVAAGKASYQQRAHRAFDPKLCEDSGVLAGSAKGSSTLAPPRDWKKLPPIASPPKGVAECEELDSNFEEKYGEWRGYAVTGNTVGAYPGLVFESGCTDIQFSKGNSGVLAHGYVGVFGQRVSLQLDLDLTASPFRAGQTFAIRGNAFEGAKGKASLKLQKGGRDFPLTIEAAKLTVVAATGDGRFEELLVEGTASNAAGTERTPFRLQMRLFR